MHESISLCWCFFIYASSDENAVLAQAFDERRDNLRNSQRVFLIVYVSNDAIGGFRPQPSYLYFLTYYLSLTMYPSAALHQFIKHFINHCNLQCISRVIQYSMFQLYSTMSTISMPAISSQLSQFQLSQYQLSQYPLSKCQLHRYNIVPLSCRIHPAAISLLRFSQQNTHHRHLFFLRFDMLALYNNMFFQFLNWYFYKKLHYF